MLPCNKCAYKQTIQDKVVIENRVRIVPSEFVECWLDQTHPNVKKENLPKVNNPKLAFLFSYPGNFLPLLGTKCKYFSEKVSTIPRKQLSYFGNFLPDTEEGDRDGARIEYYPGITSKAKSRRKEESRCTT